MKLLTILLCVFNIAYAIFGAAVGLNVWGVIINAFVGGAPFMLMIDELIQ